VTVSEIHEEFKEFDYLSLKKFFKYEIDICCNSETLRAQITILILIYILRLE